MKHLILLLSFLLPYQAYAQESILRITHPTLMHEVRKTPSPLDGQTITMNPPRFMWPDKYPHLGRSLMESKKKISSRK